MKKGIRVALLLGVFTLSGCTVPAKSVDSNDIIVETKKVSEDSLLKDNVRLRTHGFGGTLSVLISRNQISEVRNSVAKTSLINALKQAGLYDGNGEYLLEATLIEDDFDEENNTRHLEIKYDLIDTKNRYLILSRNIISQGEAPMNIYFLGDTGDASYRSATSAFENNFSDLISLIIDINIEDYLEEE